MLTSPGLFHAFTTQSNFYFCVTCVYNHPLVRHNTKVLILLGNTYIESIVGKCSKDLQGNRKNIKKKIWERDVDIHVQRK